MKKKKNAILKSQIEQYEKLLNEVTKEEEENIQNEDQVEELKNTTKSNFVTKIKSF